jgi:hypothetical protein
VRATIVAVVRSKLNVYCAWSNGRRAEIGHMRFAAFIGGTLATSRHDISTGRRAHLFSVTPGDGRRKKTWRVSENANAIHWARGHRRDFFRRSSVWLRQERRLRGGYSSGDNTTSRHRQRIDYSRWSDGRHSEQSNDFEGDHEEPDHEKSANKAQILDCPCRPPSQTDSSPYLHGRSRGEPFWSAGAV